MSKTNDELEVLSLSLDGQIKELQAKSARLLAERDEARSLANHLRYDLGAYAKFPWDGPDIAVCSTCGRGFDMSSFDEVAAHERCGDRGAAVRTATGIKGHKVVREDVK